MPVHSDEPTSSVLHARFGYCFATPPGSDYPPILEDRRLDRDRPTVIDGPGGPVEALPFVVDHGRTEALGFRFGNVAYAPDVSRVPDAAVERLQDLDILILDALRYTPHPTHFSVSEALAFIDAVKPKRAVLTNMHTDIDFETLRGELPDGIEPAYDGMVLTWTA